MAEFLINLLNFQVSVEQNYQALEVEALRLQQRRETESSGGHKDSEDITLSMKHLEGQVDPSFYVQGPIS